MMSALRTSLLCSPLSRIPPNGADYFLEGLALGSRLGQRLQALPALPPLCWYSWVLLGTWPALGALGALAQWKLMDAEHGGHANGELPPWYRQQTTYVPGSQT